ncbi:hypothetical protein V1520DRAFT_349000 [Lipomyces starkeyi]|uniref:Phytanoyl-CoA dioxygenase n=1 Tax=Lipomyces starkeyi NRRL Y-11557 TaxID=675824 RepID=A0A1E3Q259_LIPST|nr:hypothetical protein LIPSTDRAFT_73531 [Lipomyces starkeyi NRRL Y-11557]
MTVSDEQCRRTVPSRLYANGLSLSDFEELTSQTINAKIYPLATAVISNVPVYDLSSFDITDLHVTSALQDEWHHIILSGPGVLVLRSMFPDPYLLDSASRAFVRIINREKSQSRGDHFAKGGQNHRIWNSFGKHAAVDPASFVEYYSNPWLALICDAWLGPAYRVTAQVNIVKPGGAAQIAHRDYHLGFQTAESCARFPIAMQIASQLLTLQGAIAHTDMPVESGPTRLLPFSQKFEEGFLAYRRPEFTDYFLEHFISLPLQKGDGIFFNSALFHAAGCNKTSSLERSANLLQISSAFGKPMESIDSIAVIDRTWDAISEKVRHGGLTKEVRAFVAAVADGYPFPTNLDNRPPGPDGMAPESEQELLLRSLEENWSKKKVLHSLSQMRDDSLGRINIQCNAS